MDLQRFLFLLFAPSCVFLGCNCILPLRLADVSVLPVSDTYLLEGETLTINCTLSNGLVADGYSWKDIYFDLSTNGKRIQNFTSATNLKRVNQTTAMLEVIVDIRMAGSYSCYGANYHGDPHVIGSTTDIIQVERQPESVTNFSCVVHNWGKNMTCSWQHPVNYVDDGNINVTLTYSFSTGGESPYTKMCPSITFNECVWDDSHFEDSPDYAMRVTVTNMPTEVFVYGDHLVDPLIICKPDPVVGAAVSAAGAGCLLLSWIQPSQYHTVVYRIKYGNNGNVPLKENEKFSSGNKKYQNVTVCSLEPYVEYSFSIQAKPTKPWEGFWSRATVTSGRTQQEVPGEGPVITHGSYVRSKTGDLTKEKVTFYWKPVVKTEWNGVIDVYQIRLNNQSISKTSGDCYVTREIPFQNIELQVQIFAHNAAGFSRPSTWILQPQQDIVLVPEILKESFAASVRGSSVVAIWDGAASLDQYNMTVYWCMGSITNYLCQDFLSWKHVQPNDNLTDLQLKSKEATYFLYGISVLDPHTMTSSGIFWTKCLLQNKAIPIPESFQVIALYRAVKASWTEQRCLYQSGYKITGYNFTWYKGRGDPGNKVQCQILLPNSTQNQISQLEPGEDYSFSLQTLSYEKFSQHTEWVVVSPLDSSSDNPSVVWIIIVFVSSITVLCCVVFCCYRCIKSKKKYSDDFKAARNYINMTVSREDNEKPHDQRGIPDQGNHQVEVSRSKTSSPIIPEEIPDLSNPDVSCSTNGSTAFLLPSMTKKGKKQSCWKDTPAEEVILRKNPNGCSEIDRAAHTVASPSTLQDYVAEKQVDQGMDNITFAEHYCQITSSPTTSNNSQMTIAQPISPRASNVNEATQVVFNGKMPNTFMNFKEPNQNQNPEENVRLELTMPHRPVESEGTPLSAHTSSSGFCDEQQVNDNKTSTNKTVFNFKNPLMNQNISAEPYKQSTEAFLDKASTTTSDNPYVLQEHLGLY